MTTETVNVTLMPYMVNNMENRSKQYISYVITGTVTVGMNLLFLVIVLCHWKFALKWPLIIGMLVANIGNGMHNLFYGIYRLVLLRNGTIDQPYSAWNCMLTMIPTVSLVGALLPGILQCLVGFERLAAIVAYQWFSVHWTCRKIWLLTAGSYLFTAIAWLVPAWYFVFREYFVITRECATPMLINHYIGLSALYYTTGISALGAVMTICSSIIGRARLARTTELLGGSARKFTKQVRITGLLTAVAVLDLVLVIIPSFLMILALAGVAIPPELIYYNSVLDCAYCSGNVGIYICLNKDFRQLLTKSFKSIGSTVTQKQWSSRQSNVHTKTI